ncbi:hypothetical protein Tco_0612512 [Tanacetum coccineum]
MKSGLKSLNTARQNSSRATISVNTAKPINTAYPKPIVNCVKIASNVFNREHSHGNVTTARPKAVVCDKNGNEANTVKAAIQVYDGLGPQESLILLLFVQGNQQLELQEKGVINSGCSRHMTGNKSYLSDYEEIDGGFVAFG